MIAAGVAAVYQFYQESVVRGLHLDRFPDPMREGLCYGLETSRRWKQRIANRLSSPRIHKDFSQAFWDISANIAGMIDVGTGRMAHGGGGAGATGTIDSNDNSGPSSGGSEGLDTGANITLSLDAIQLRSPGNTSELGIPQQCLPSTQGCSSPNVQVEGCSSRRAEQCSTSSAQMPGGATATGFDTSYSYGRRRLSNDAGSGRHGILRGSLSSMSEPRGNRKTSSSKCVTCLPVPYAKSMSSAL